MTVEDFHTLPPGARLVLIAAAASFAHDPSAPAEPWPAGTILYPFASGTVFDRPDGPAVAMRDGLVGNGTAKRWGWVRLADLEQAP